MDVYRELGVEPVINASGSVTRLGGALMPPDVIAAFAAAAQHSVPIEQIQAAACRKIAELTGAEAGLVTAGSAAALTLGAAAILARFDLGRMEQLPDTSGMPARFLIAREQRSGYDHAVRAAGAKLVEVGFNEQVAGAGVRRTEIWEYEAAIDEQTAALYYTFAPDSQPPLEQLIELGRRKDLPVLVDAAGELPPRSNLRTFIEMGADLVAFSGGKAIRGPQATGILCGSRDLVGSAALQMFDMDDHFELWDPPTEFVDKQRLRGIPRHGMGRGMKVAKEQVVALLKALTLFESGAYEADLEAWNDQFDAIIAELRAAPVQVVKPALTPEANPQLIVRLDDSAAITATELCRRLRRGSPPIYPGHGRLHENALTVSPLCLDLESARTLGRRITEELASS